MTDYEVRFFSDPLCTLPMFAALLIYGGPTARHIGTALAYGRPVVPVLVVWGSSACTAAVYFILLHIRCRRRGCG